MRTYVHTVSFKTKQNKQARTKGPRIWVNPVLMCAILTSWSVAAMSSFSSSLHGEPQLITWDVLLPSWALNWKILSLSTPGKGGRQTSNKREYNKSFVIGSIHRETMLLINQMCQILKLISVLWKICRDKTPPHWQYCVYGLPYLEGNLFPVRL